MQPVCTPHALSTHPCNTMLKIRRYCAKLGGTKKCISKSEVNTERVKTGDEVIVPVI